MASSINDNNPTTGSPTTDSVRQNFTRAKNEINGLLRSSLDVVTTLGSGTAYVADFSNNVVKAEGARIIVKAHLANTGSATLNVDATGASTIKNLDGSSLVAGQIGGTSHYLDLIYNSSNSTWVLLNPVHHALAIADVSGLQTALNGKLGTGDNAVSATTAANSTKWGNFNVSQSATGTTSTTIYFRT
jgi:hypothetical protein